jgi:hypothetical protein
MTSTTGNNGRLGNQIIRNLAVSLIAEKNNLKVNYFNKEIINQLGIELFSGTNIHKDTCVLNEQNYFSIYNSNTLNYNLNPNKSFFQTKEITNLLYSYLHTDSIKSNIIEKNSFKERYNTNNDLFIHIRLGDVSSKNPGINYYLNTIKNIQFDHLYISTDSNNDTIIKTIMKNYPNATLMNYNEQHTIQYASTCKHIILSHGTFSSVIGYLSFFSTIYYPDHTLNKIWYGDIFSIDGWIKCNIN